MKHLKIYLCMTCIFFPMISGCSSKEPTLQKYAMTATDLGFDTVVSFTAYTESEEIYKTYEETVKELFKHYDQLFSKYDTYPDINNIKTINEQAGKQPVKVDKDIIDMLQISKEYGVFSNNEFDVTMGSVLNIWHDHRELAEKDSNNTSVPTQEELEKANTYTGWNHIHIDENKQTVYIDNANTQLDVGGVAKGYAVEKIAQKLEDMGCKHAIINGGGNIRLIGNKPEAEYWSVGIQIPDFHTVSTESLISIKINESKSFVTSGDYQRFYTYNDQIIHHIIDPTTLQPARHCRSVTVITDNSGIADILSTALFTLSHKEGQDLLDKLKETKGIEAGAIWVYDKTQPKEDDSDSIKVNKYDIVISESLQDDILDKS